MPKERSEYRDILEDIDRYFNGKRLLTQTDVAKYLGITRKTVSTRFNVTNHGISSVALAQRLSEL